MACLLVPAAEAIVVTIAAKTLEKREKEAEKVSVSFDGTNIETAHKIPFSRKLKWLSWLQLSGCILLAFEHIWHGEIVPWFPFLSAMGNPSDKIEMIHEMATVGVAMAVLTTVVWVAMLAVAHIIEKRAIEEQPVAVSE